MTYQNGRYVHFPYTGINELSKSYTLIIVIGSCSRFYSCFKLYSFMGSMKRYSNSARCFSYQIRDNSVCRRENEKASKNLSEKCKTKFHIDKTIYLHLYTTSITIVTAAWEVFPRY